jgi:hypothetical protein
MVLILVEDQLHINQEKVCQVLHEDFGKRKICAKFVLHSLMDEQKERRVTACEDFIAAWWRSATHCIHLTLCQPTFFYTLK